MQSWSVQSVEAWFCPAAWIGCRAAAAWVGQRLREVDADAHHGQPEPQADTRRVLEWIAEIVEGVADVHEHRKGEVARQIADQLCRTGEEVATADPRATLIER